MTHEHHPMCGQFHLDGPCRGHGPAKGDPATLPRHGSRPAGPAERAAAVKREIATSTSAVRITPGMRRALRRLLTIDRSGVWLRSDSLDLAYWWPRAWQPLSIREGWEGRRGWWGAIRVHRRRRRP